MIPYQSWWDTSPYHIYIYICCYHKSFVMSHVFKGENLNGRGSLGNKWGFLKWVGSVFMKNMSAQLSFCSSDTIKACPNPSTSPDCCQNFFFSSMGRLKNSWMPDFTFSNNEVLTPWFTNCNDQFIFWLKPNIKREEKW